MITPIMFNLIDQVGPCQFLYSRPDLQNIRPIVIACIQRDRRAFLYASEALKEDSSLAVTQYGAKKLLQDCPEFKLSYSITIAALMQTPLVIEDVHPIFLQNERRQAIITRWKTTLVDQ